MQMPIPLHAQTCFSALAMLETQKLNAERLSETTVDQINRKAVTGTCTRSVRRSPARTFAGRRAAGAWRRGREEQNAPVLAERAGPWSERAAFIKACFETVMRRCAARCGVVRAVSST